ncbi:hypothetical protein ACFX15_023937 [Malus domestica]
MPGEVLSLQEDEKSRTFDFEASEAKRQRPRSKSPKKRTPNASLRLTQAWIQVLDSGLDSGSIEDYEMDVELLKRAWRQEKAALEIL